MEAEPGASRTKPETKSRWYSVFHLNGSLSTLESEMSIRGLSPQQKYNLVLPNWVPFSKFYSLIGTTLIDCLARCRFTSNWIEFHTCCVVLLLFELTETSKLFYLGVDHYLPSAFLVDSSTVSVTPHTDDSLLYYCTWLLLGLSGPH